ncbi:MAG TPA: ABC transporter permease [Vicinamibacterales bacterium]|nr:ABC transporter permease [Vicinamibacterales bacterium]
MIATLRHDLHFAARTLRRSPGFAVTAFVTLALGIGATSAMFSVFSAVLLKPLPWGHPDGAVMIWSRWTAFDKTWVATGEVVDYRRRMQTVRSVGAWADRQVNVTGDGEPERVAAAQVTANLFETLEARPALGRPFTAEEDTPNGPRVAVISFDLWQRRYGGDPGVIGRGVEIDGDGYQITGVMPRGFSLPTDYAAPERTELWVPLQMDPNSMDHGSHGLYAAARLAPGATVAQATGELQSIARAMTREGLYPEAMQFSAFAVSLRDEVVGSVRLAVLSVFGAVACLLLIACANVANLMLARAESRQREMALRTALGASRRRIVRQLVTEGVLLASVSGVFGLAIAAAAVRWLAWWNPAGIPRLAEARVDAVVAIFTFASAWLVAVLFSAAPALRVYRADLTEHLKEGGQNATAGTARQRFRAALIVAETALAVVLLVGAALMLRSLERLNRIDLGLETSDVLTMRVSVPAGKYASPESAVTFYRDLVRRVRAIPGVRHAAAVRSLPLASTIGDFGLTIEGYAARPGQEPKGDWQIATDGYLETLGERLVRGRSIRASDDERAMLIGLVNEQLAAKYWPGQDPIGRRFRIGRSPRRPWVTVVGIVRDVRHNGVTAPVKEKFYVPHAQWHRSVGSMRSMYLVAKGSGDVAALAPLIRREARAIDPDIPLASIRTMDEVVGAALSQPRFTGALFATFSALAVLLAAIGIYGVLSYIVTQRTREIGIRLAIGATAGAVSRGVLARGLTLAAAGVGIGAAAALLLGRAVSSLLYGVTPADPASFAGGAAVLLVVAVVASYIPARRATSVDPVIALRVE